MIIDKPATRALRFAKRTIQPVPANLRMRCGSCGGMDFEVHIRPVNGIAKVDDIVCLGCLKHRRVDEWGFVGTGKVTSIDDGFVQEAPNSIRSAELRKANGSN